MKNLKVLLVVIISVILVTGIAVFLVDKYNIDNEQNVKQELDNTFIGTIVEINSNSATISVTQGDEILASADKVIVSLKGNNFEEGDKVQVTYTGNIMETYPAKVEVVNIERVDISKLANLYTTLIKNLMSLDKALNSDIEYIAIDMESFSQEKQKDILQLTEQDKKDIVNFLYGYHDNIKIASYEELKEQGLVHPELYIDGTLIYVTQIEKKNDNNYIISMVKYRGGLAAIFPTYDAKYKNGQWTFEITQMAIS